MDCAPRTTRSRAIALAALLASDYDLEALSCMAPALADEARAAAAKILADSGEVGVKSQGAARMLALEMAKLLEAAPDEELRRHWPRASDVKTPLPGLRRLVQIIALQNGPQPAFSRVPTILSEGSASSLLADLSRAMLRRAAEGERWALRLTTRAAELSTSIPVSARLVPALLWICVAHGDDELGLDRVAASWPPDLGDGLEEIRERISPSVCIDASLLATLRSELEKELSRRG